MISNEEQTAISDLINLSNELQAYSDDVDVDHDDYNNELKHFEQRIDDEFDLLFLRLNERKKKLKGKLKQIVIAKEKNYETMKKKYQLEQDTINKTKSECHQILNEAIEVEKLTERKQSIQKLTQNAKKTLKNISDEQYKSSEIVHFFDILSEPTLNAVNSMEIIAKSIQNPKLLSITNNGKNHVIVMQWVVDKSCDEQIKIEWTKVSENETFVTSDDEKKQDEYDWNYTLIKNGNMSHAINVKQNGMYLCRMSYFDIYLKDNLISNTLSVRVHCHVLWDRSMSGNNIDFVGNRAKLKENCWNTLFGKEIIARNVNKFKFHYRIKIHHACDRGGGFMIGIIANNKVSASMTRSFTKYGGVALNKGGLLFPGGKRYTNVTWRDGDIVDVFVDMKKMTLSFAYNGVNLGVAFRNIPNSVYRFALTLLYEDDEVELIDLQPNK